MIANNTRWDIGNTVTSPDGDMDEIVGVQVTSYKGQIIGKYMLKNSFVWYTLNELLEV